ALQFSPTLLVMKMEDRLFQTLLLLGVFCSQCLHGQYILIQTSKTWDEAQAFCRQNHLHLATFHNETDWENFREMMSASNFSSKVWLGLYVDFNTWRWSYQNQNLTLTEWDSGEPNNARGSEECGVLIKDRNKILWNDVHCYAHLSCVCYHGLLDVVGWDGRLFHFCQTVNADRENEACGLADSQGGTEDGACSLLLPFVCSQGQRRQIVRFEVKSNRSTENDAEIQAVILQQINEELLRHGMAASTKATWRVQTDGRLFHKRDPAWEREPSLDPTTNLNETCDQTVGL
ncbi:putative C-type mannose receptor 2-like, partial [Triplophysa rosa]